MNAGTKRVHANQVYQEYIADKQHLHMNATRWLTLTSFVKWLGREGHCTVDETEKGWFITYIDRDPDTIRKQESLAKKEKLDLDDQDRLARFIDKQIERDRERTGESQDVQFTELKREDEEEKVVFALAPTSSKQKEDSKKKYVARAFRTSRMPFSSLIITLTFSDFEGSNFPSSSFGMTGRVVNV